MATAVIEVDVADGVADRAVSDPFDRAFVLVRMRGRALGTVSVPVRDGLLNAADVRQAIDDDRDVSHSLTQAALDEWLLPAGRPVEPPSWSVVICTRDRPDHLQRCLDSLAAANVTDGEVLVVDNGPSDGRTMRLVKQYPVRYVRTERPGLNHARGIGARLVSGDVIVFTDDDVVVDKRWLPALLQEFVGSPRVGAVTGPGLPLELTTNAQELLERYSGFGRGFVRRTFDYTNMPPAAASNVGSGLNMAMRRDLVMTLGLFDVELDRGTAAITGGDTYAFYRLLAEGYRIVYVPDALVWHSHRKDAAAVREIVRGYSVGVYACLTRCVVMHHDLNAARVGLQWFFDHHARELARSLLRRPRRAPARLVLGEIAGACTGPIAYWRTRRVERQRVGESQFPVGREGVDEPARM